MVGIYKVLLQLFTREVPSITTDAGISMAGAQIMFLEFQRRIEPSIALPLLAHERRVLNTIQVFAEASNFIVFLNGIHG